jgi:hypothetical protein
MVERTIRYCKCLISMFNSTSKLSLVEHVDIPRFGAVKGKKAPNIPRVEGDLDRIRAHVADTKSK